MLLESKQRATSHLWALQEVAAAMKSVAQATASGSCLAAYEHILNHTGKNAGYNALTHSFTRASTNAQTNTQTHK